MDFAPYQWRFDGGLQPAEDSIPYYFRPLHPVIEPPVTYMQGPIPIRAVFSHPAAPPPPPPPPPAAIVPRPSAAPNPPVQQAQQQQRQSQPHRPRQPKNPFAPPHLRPGTNYLFPRAHTILHIFSKASPIWEARYHGRTLAFKVFKVGTQFRVQDVILRVLGHHGGDGDGSGNDDEDNNDDSGHGNGNGNGKGAKKKMAKRDKDAEAEAEARARAHAQGWAATEVLEQGDGKWTKGGTVAFGSDRATASLESVGWDARRGKGLPPVWLVVHKV